MSEFHIIASYDDIADVLYLTSARGVFTRNLEDEAGLVLRYDAKTQAPVGATVVDYKEHWLPQQNHLADRLSAFFGVSREYANMVIRSAV